MILVCTIMIAIKAGGINWITNADVKGKLLAKSETSYLVDFSEGLDKYKLAGDRNDYSQVLVNKDKCVELK